MMEPIEQLPAQLNRRNWIILGVLLVATLPFGNWRLTAGVACGGLVSVGGFLWMHRSLDRLIAEPTGGARFRYQFGYLIRLVVLAVVLGLLIAVLKTDPLGLIIGVSVVVINLFWLTIQRVVK